MRDVSVRDDDRLSLEAKIEIAKVVLNDALNSFKRLVVLSSMDKDSIVATHLVMLVRDEQKSDMLPVLFVDHGQHFEETHSMAEKLAKDWSLILIRTKNEDLLHHVDDGGRFSPETLNHKNKAELEKIGLQGESLEVSDPRIFDRLLNVVPLHDALAKYRFDSVIIGKREKNVEDFAKRLFIGPGEHPDYAVVRPILPFSEKDTWDYTFKFKLPIHPLYYKGYRDVSNKHMEDKSDHPPWKEYIEKPPRGTKLSAEDEEAIEERLRRLGYM